MLQEDGRRSFSDIADETKRTEVTIRRRVKRLRKLGVIKKFTVVIDPLKIGKQIRAIIRVKTLMKQASAIAEKIKEFDEVIEAVFLDGTCGLMLKVIVQDHSELLQFLEKGLGKVPGVGEFETCIVLDDIKSSF